MCEISNSVLKFQKNYDFTLAIFNLFYKFDGEKNRSIKLGPTFLGQFIQSHSFYTFLCRAFMNKLKNRINYNVRFSLYRFVFRCFDR